jgi:hypothetical protein
LATCLCKSNRKKKPWIGPPSPSTGPPTHPRAAAAASRICASSPSQSLDPPPRALAGGARCASGSPDPEGRCHAAIGSRGRRAAATTRSLPRIWICRRRCSEEDVAPPSDLLLGSSSVAAVAPGKMPWRHRIQREEGRNPGRPRPPATVSRRRRGGAARPASRHRRAGAARAASRRRRGEASRPMSRSRQTRDHAPPSGKGHALSVGPPPGKGPRPCIAP